MVHLRLITPTAKSESVLQVLTSARSVCNLIHLPGSAKQPSGDVMLCDVAREDASVVIASLQAIGLDQDGSISVENVDSSISRVADAAELTAPGSPADAVVWEQVGLQVAEEAQISGSFIVFMVLAMLIAAAGILLDTPILIVGAMVVGPEFGPLAGICVSAVVKRVKLTAKSVTALAVGFPLAITVTYLVVQLLKLFGLVDETFSSENHQLAVVISKPDFFSFFVAFCAGIAGMLSLTTAKSSALVGVLISVTTIPAAANIAITCAYGHWSDWLGSQAQLAINMVAIIVAGTLTLAIQRWLYVRRLNIARSNQDVSS